MKGPREAKDFGPQLLVTQLGDLPVDKEPQNSDSQNKPRVKIKLESYESTT